MVWHIWGAKLWPQAMEWIFNIRHPAMREPVRQAVSDLCSPNFSQCWLDCFEYVSFPIPRAETFSNGTTTFFPLFFYLCWFLPSFSDKATTTHPSTIHFFRQKPCSGFTNQIYHKICPDLPPFVSFFFRQILRSRCAFFASSDSYGGSGPSASFTSWFLGQKGHHLPEHDTDRDPKVLQWYPLPTRQIWLAPIAAGNDDVHLHEDVGLVVLVLRHVLQTARACFNHSLFNRKECPRTAGQPVKSLFFVFLQPLS